MLGANRAATGTIENDDTASVDAALKSLAISGTTLTPSFAAGIYSYAGEIDKTTASVTVDVETNHDGASVVIGGDDDPASATQANLDMAFGDNVFTVTVTAQDGATTQEYEITLTRAPPEVDWEDQTIFIQEDSGDIELTVTLSPASVDTVTVDYATVGGTVATAGEDYTATSGTLTFSPGETEKTITVTILDDTLYEPNGAGNVNVELSNLTGTAKFAAGELTRVVFLIMSQDNDLPPTATVTDVDVDEAAATMAFTLELSHGIEADIAYTTTSSRVSGTAVKGSDYAFIDFNSEKFDLPARQISATFDVTLIDDDVDEEDESLTIEWSYSGLHSATSSITATATIRDNDTRGVTVSETVLDIDEGNVGTYTVVLTSAPTGSVTVTPSQDSGDADVTVSDALTFTAMNWNVAQTVTVSAAQDTDAVDDTATIEHAVAGGDYGANSVTADDVAITVDDDELPPALALSVNAIATDDIINILEKGAGFSISGDTGSEGGAAVTVTLGSTELTATSADADPAIWSVNVAPDATYITGTSVAVSVTASKIGFTSPSALERSLTVDLAAPTAPGYTAPTSLQVGVAITAMSPNGGADIDEYSATDLPSGLILDPSTGAISGTPGTANNSTTSTTVTVRDAAGNTATVSISFPAVTKGDQALSGFAYSASSATYGSTVPSVIAPTGVQTTLSYSATPAEVCTVDSANGALTLVGVGSCVITATAAATDELQRGHRRLHGHGAGHRHAGAEPRRDRR